jgi:cobalamin biosynthesis protein CobT
MAQKSDLYSTNNFVVTTASTDINEKLNEPYGDSNFSWASGEGSDDDFYSLEGDYSNAKGDKKSKNKAGGYADRRDKRVESVAKAREAKAQAKLEEAKAKGELAKQSGKDDGTTALLSQNLTPTDVSLADTGMPSKNIMIGVGVVALLGIAYFGFGKQLGIRK